MQDLYDFLEEIDRLDEQASKRMTTILNATKELEQLPHLAWKIMEISENPDSSVSDLEKVVRNDPSTASKILKIANSSFYGLEREVSDLPRAILILGLKTIRDLVIASAVLNLFRSPDPVSIRVWEHSVATAIGARLISLDFEHAQVDEAFVCGLLHDVGNQILLKNLGKPYSDMLLETEGDEEQRVEIEKRIFGFTHAQIGGELAKKWNLSPSLEKSLRYHHHFREVMWTDIDERVKMIIALVSLASKMAHALGLGSKEDDEVDYLKLALTAEAQFLTLPKARLMELGEQIKKTFFEENSLFI